MFLLVTGDVDPDYDKDQLGKTIETEEIIPKTSMKIPVVIPIPSGCDENNKIIKGNFFVRTTIHSFELKIFYFISEKNEVVDSGKPGIPCGIFQAMVSISIALVMSCLLRPGT
ncbi:uncharacterized protein TNCT_124641 [Trichonephila clavata]|uniref:Uncharacterized protein n=1 Tax=Trichonephila clavata TaxID=2740835 RepID=A0A8X6J5C4_TRICU|nr:uncharacterized protein TNCT_124641 [Trichonephila clavata]